MSDAQYERMARLRFAELAAPLSAAARSVVHLFGGRHGSPLNPFPSTRLARLRGLGIRHSAAGKPKRQLGGKRKRKQQDQQAAAAGRLLEAGF
jgi:hypothetical protein